MFGARDRRYSPASYIIALAGDQRPSDVCESRAVQRAAKLSTACGRYVTSRHARSRERSRHAAPFSGETAGRSCPWLGCVYVHNTQRLMGRFMGIWGFFVHCRHTLNRAKWLSEFCLQFTTLGKLLHAISHSTQVLLARLHSAWKSVRKLTFFSQKNLARFETGYPFRLL